MRILTWCLILIFLTILAPLQEASATTSVFRGGVGLAGFPLCSTSQNACGQITLFAPAVTQILNVPAANALFDFVEPTINMSQVDGAGDCAGATGPCYDWRQIDTWLNQILNCNGVSGGGPGCGARGLALILAADAGAGQNNNVITPTYVGTATYATAIGASFPNDICGCSNMTGGASSPYQLNTNGCATSGCYWNETGANGALVTSSDKTGFYVPYELPFQTASFAFYNQAILHFSDNCELGLGGSNGLNETDKDCANAAAITASIKYLRAGTPGAESYNVCVNVMPHDAGFTSAQDEYILHAGTNHYHKFVAQIKTSMQAAGVKYPFIFNFRIWQVAGDTTTPDDEATEVDNAGMGAQFGLGNNGGQNSDFAAASQGGSTNADWLNIFSTHKMLKHQLQPFTLSVPDGSSSPGSLVALWPFAKQNGADIWEHFLCDGFFMAVSSFASLPTGPGSGNNDCAISYTSAQFDAYGGVNGYYAQMNRQMQAGTFGLY